MPRARVRTGPLPVLALVLVAALTGCGSAVAGRAVAGAVPPGDRALVDDYVAALNRAGDDSPRAQAAFLRATQDPGVPMPPAHCFDTVTVHTDLVDRTLRPARPDWAPPSASGRTRPAGAVYVAAVAVTTRHDGAMLREDVGSSYLVVRDGRVHGYAVCPL